MVIERLHLVKSAALHRLYICCYSQERKFVTEIEMTILKVAIEK